MDLVSRDIFITFSYNMNSIQELLDAAIGFESSKLLCVSFMCIGTGYRMFVGTNNFKLKIHYNGHKAVQ